MDANPPATADYAWSDARRAQERINELERRLAKLEADFAQHISSHQSMPSFGGYYR